MAKLGQLDAALLGNQENILRTLAGQRSTMQYSIKQGCKNVPTIGKQSRNDDIPTGTPLRDRALSANQNEMPLLCPK